MARRRAKEHFQSLTPEPVAGRKHIDVQTEFYLEELSNRIEEADVDCQTDGFLDRPPSPLFIPAKTGADAATQVLDGDVSLTLIPFSLLNYNVPGDNLLQLYQYWKRVYIYISKVGDHSWG